MRTRLFAMGLCVALALCAGCDSNNDNAKTTAEASATAAIESAYATFESEETLAPTLTDGEASPSASATAPSPNEPSNSLQRYIDAIPGDHKDQVVMFNAEEDLDLDGVKEVVLGLGTGTEGSDFNWVDDLYVLRDVGGEVMRIGDNLAGDGYGTCKVKLVQLEGKPQTYIYSGLTNGSSLYGFQLYELKGGVPTSIVYSASATGDGEDDLTDQDGNGKFDGYTQGRTSYDVFYYDVLRKFDWSPDDNAFVQSNTSIDLPSSEYPESINEVIYQYLSLRILDDGFSDELTQRLSELCAMPDPLGVSLPDETWGAAVYDKAMEIEGSYQAYIVEKGDKASAVVKASTEDNRTAQLTFELENQNNEWRIVSIMD